MRVVILGAGVIGVASAWYLREAGHEVTVVDRQPGPGLETSFANGGQISVTHAEPWANPAAPLQILEWLGRPDAPLLFRPRADLDQWLWGARFLFECLPQRARRNARCILALALHSVEALRALREETAIAYAAGARAILCYSTAGRDFARPAALVEPMRAWGCMREIKTVAECVALEPALRAAAPRLVGGIYAPGDESGDAHLFTQRLAALCQTRGVVFLYTHAVRRLGVAGGRVSGVEVAVPSGAVATLEADAYVVALGSHSAPLVRGIGIAIPVYPVKGYSVTLPVDSQHDAPTVSLTDEAHRLVFSRLGNRLRIAGTAELAGYDTAIDRARCEAILRRVFEMFPAAGDRDRAGFWAGLRPATPGNVPLIGGTRYPNLFLNTGHGTLGWTLACGSGKSLAAIIGGKAPETDFPFLARAQP
ncbi:MAG: D-amino acid dehydrogenase [Burkholderiales bacterium]